MTRFKTETITVRLDPDLYQRVIAKSEETAVNYSEIVRRALENWVATGTVPARVASTGKAEAVPAEGNGEE